MALKEAICNCVWSAISSHENLRWNWSRPKSSKNVLYI